MKKQRKYFNNSDENFKKNLRIKIMILAVMLFISVTVIILNFERSDSSQNMLINEAVIPWNPGSTADIMIRTLLDEVAPDVIIRNVRGANGADGINEIYSAPHDGSAVLGTSLSSIITSNLCGFIETGYNDWEMWLTAYAPSIIAVRADSPYASLSDLVTAAQKEELLCANAGNGTFSFISALLFADGANIKVKYMSYSGSNPAINAVVNGEVDFIVALSSEMIERLRSGELRALASLSDNEFTLKGVTKSIKPAIETIPELSVVAPFGEYYGVMIPADTNKAVLNDYDDKWGKAVKSEAFTLIVDNKGVLLTDIRRENSKKSAEHNASLICWVLYDTGIVSVSPDKIGIERPYP